MSIKPIVNTQSKIKPILTDEEAKATKVNLQTEGGKDLGKVSASAYSAIRGNYLDKYSPIDENEKTVLEEYKKAQGGDSTSEKNKMVISDYVPGAFNMTKREYLLRQQSNPDMPEFGSYEYFKNREEKLRPMLEEIADDPNRTDDTYRAWAENYGKDHTWAEGKAVQKTAQKMYAKFKYQDAIIEEYKDIDSQLKNSKKTACIIITMLRTR